MNNQAYENQEQAELMPTKMLTATATNMRILLTAISLRLHGFVM